MPIRAMVSMLAALSMFACSGADTQTDDGDALAGPCVHRYDDEVLHIDEAYGASSGVRIDEVQLSQFSIDAVPISAAEVFAQRGSGLELDGELLRCTLPCSMGVMSGQRQFVASADAYMDTSQRFNASYASFVGGCPSSNADGSHVSISLE